MPVFNINTDAVVILTNKLELSRKSAIPSAVRNTLNETALDVKMVTMPAESDRVFHKRKPTFFNATSRTEFARGFSLPQMAAVVGFVAPPNVKESGHATKDLQDQEYGGDIDKRAFIATDKGRTGHGNVKDALTMKMIKSHIVDAKKENGKNDAERFVRSALKVGYGGNGVGGYVIGTGKNGRGNRALLKIISIHRAKAGERAGVKSGNMVINAVPIYTVKANRKAHVQATHFMQRASEQSAKKMNEIFTRQAEFQLNKVMKT